MIKLTFALLLSLTIGLAACGGDGDSNAGDDGIGSGPPPAEGTSRTTDSGLQIIEIEAGTGEGAEVGDAVAVHYTGWLANGTKFDSSLDRGEPFTFVLGAGQVIAGWDEGVLGMAPGGKRRLIIPADLAYGEQARGQIPPNAELTFDVEMVAFARPTE